MNALTMVAPETACFELRFRSLADDTPGCAFPCDAAGRVDMDALSDTARDKYLYARTVVGCVFARPAVSVSAAR